MSDTADEFEAGTRDGEPTPPPCVDCRSVPGPLAGWIPFDEPGEALVLWDGDLLARASDGSLVPRAGRVTLDWRRPGNLQWAATDGTPHSDPTLAWHAAFRLSNTVSVDFGGRLSELDASLGTEDGGVLHGGIIGDPDAICERVIAHWIDLPQLMFGDPIHAHSRGSWTTWRGRTSQSIHGWDLTADARRDLGDVFARAKSRGDCVMTHIMEVRRSDGATFTAGQARDLLFAVQCAVSFALGYWVYPAVPIGFDTDGDAVWTEWRPGFVDPPRGGLGWWNQQRPDDLWELVERYLDHWETPDRQSLRVATIQAVSAIEGGFVEQRLLTTFTALEMLSWVTEVRERAPNNRRRKAKDAAQRLRRMLTAANVPLTVDAARTPALASWAKSQSKIGDGPAAISAVRNRLAHPKDNSDLYDAKGLLFEAHLLALRYLELLLLHRLGYTGHLCDRTRRARWAGESDPAPWTGLNR